MSYGHLIQGVSNDLSITSYEALETIDCLLSYVGQKPFTKRIFEKKWSNETISSFLRHFTASILTEKIAYECKVEGNQEVTDNPKALCEFCNTSIYGNYNHETESLYQSNKEELKKFFLFVTKQREDHYIDPRLRDNVNDLIKRKKEIIPFIGSGLSLPFGIPMWGGLLKEMKPSFDKPYLEETFKDYIETGELMDGLDFLKDKSLNFSKESHLQQKIVSIILEKENKYVPEDKHNYTDLIKFNSNFYISTNYDLILSKIISDYDEYTRAKTFEEMDDSQSMHVGKNQVLHLHGHIEKSKEMVVSNESYEEFYGNPKNKTKLAALIGSKTLLFLGFSFSDAFFEKLLLELNSVIGGTHYIVVANPEIKTVRKFLDKDLRVIGLNVKKDGNKPNTLDYVNALRVLINLLDRS